jgi:hypothetical protein
MTTEKITKNVEECIYGLIAACDPVSYRQILSECQTQVIDFEKMPPLHQSIAVDKALNNLLGEQKIVIESCDCLIGFRLI